MRVAILTQYYPPEIGAPQSRLSELAARFVRKGHDVTVLTAMPNYPTGKIYSGYGGLYRREERDGITIKRTAIFPTKRVELLPRLLNYFSFVASSIIGGVLALPRADFLLTESPPLFLGISGYLLSRMKGARLIFNVSDLWPESAVRMGLAEEGLFLNLAWKLERFCYKTAWLVTCQSREILSNIQLRYPNVSLHHLSNGVDTAVFRPDLRSEALHEEFAGKRCLALYAGLHGAAQGLDQLLQAARRLQDDDSIQFVFAGDGPEKEMLQAHARSMQLRNVCFFPPFPRNRMPAITASADISLVTLKGHLPGAVPSKIYEAMGAGVPIVLAAEGEPARLVRETRSGIVVRPGDASAIAAAVKTLASDRAQRTALGQAGRCTAVNRFDRCKICDQLIDLMEKVAVTHKSVRRDRFQPAPGKTV